MPPVYVLASWTRPILPDAHSANQAFPSAPIAIPRGLLAGAKPVNSVMEPSGVMRPIRLPAVLPSVNQPLRSGAVATEVGWLNAVSPIADSAIAPSVVICSMALPDGSANQRVPAEARAMPYPPTPRRAPSNTR
jgi:hypothetical protein